MEKVTIKNISTATIVIASPEMKFRREIIPGRTISVSKEDYEELIFDPGILGLIQEHYILVEGLDEDDENAQENVYEKDTLNTMLDNLDVTAFAKFIPTAAQAEKDTIVQLAVDKGITHPAFVKLIKQYCDVDIINAINRKHLLESD